MAGFPSSSRVANSRPQGLAVPARGKEAASALEETPALGATDTVAGEESPDGVSKAAKRYLEACRVEYSSEAVQQAVKLGSELLRLSGSVEKAACALNRERVALLRNHLSFTEEGHVIGISDLHKAYLIKMAQQGVPSRREAAPARELAKNHGSVRDHEDELMQKAWKDAAYGALMVDPETPGVESVLTRSGVSESPLGRVPKQNPDRTVSAKGRPINDMRKRNEHGSKFNHPPAPQPRHPGVARQALWWNARHPKIPLRCAKRDVPRAFEASSGISWHPETSPSSR